jgi:hypothetical protein
MPQVPAGDVNRSTRLISLNLCGIHIDRELEINTPNREQWSYFGLQHTKIWNLAVISPYFLWQFVLNRCQSKREESDNHQVFSAKI